MTMRKIQVFVPFTDTRDKMAEYFDNQDIIRLGGGPFITEGVSRNADFEHFQTIAFLNAQEQAAEAAEGLDVDRETPFYDEFLAHGEVIGYEFDFYACETGVAFDDEDDDLFF